MLWQRGIDRGAAAKLGLICLLVWTMAGTSNAQQPGAAPATPAPAIAPETAPTAQPPEDYLISAEDLLDIFIIDVPELSRQYRVTPSGLLEFPFLTTPLKAEGRTPSQLAGDLAEALRSKGMVSNPHISIAVKESRLHSVAIAGAVKKPQIYPVFGRTSLLDILSLAGGLEDDAGSVVRVTRGPMGQRMMADAADKSADTAQQSFTVDLKRLLETGDPALNVPIYPGDNVTVPLGGVVYVVGAVNKPGGFVLSAQRQGMTVMQVLALAEDAKSTALKDKAMVVRRGAQYAGGRQEIPVNLKAILAGKQQDFVLQANDVLYVPDSSSRKAFRRGAEAALQTLTGIAIYRR